jgi:hypothetical protein
MHFDNAHNLFLQRRVNWREKIISVSWHSPTFCVILFIYCLALSDALEGKQKQTFMFFTFVFGAIANFSFHKCPISKSCTFLSLSPPHYNRNVHIFKCPAGVITLTLTILIAVNCAVSSSLNSFSFFHFFMGNKKWHLSVYYIKSSNKCA